MESQYSISHDQNGGMRRKLTDGVISISQLFFLETGTLEISVNCH